MDVDDPQAAEIERLRGLLTTAASLGQTLLTQQEVLKRERDVAHQQFAAIATDHQLQQLAQREQKRADGADGCVSGGVSEGSGRGVVGGCGSGGGGGKAVDDDVENTEAVLAENAALWRRNQSLADEVATLREVIAWERLLTHHHRICPAVLITRC